MKVTDRDIAAWPPPEPEKSFKELVSRFSEPIYWHVRRMVVSHADAQDVVQETFLKIFKSSADLRDDDSLKSWVYRIATNEALRHLRKNSLESYPIDDAPAGLLELRADEYTDYSDLEAVKLQKAINSLPEKQRVAFNLRYYDELSYEEIAEITGSTPASAKVSYHIAKNRVINFMNNHD